MIFAILLAALPALHADLGQTSVSGLSSGAYMAGQFAVAYSSLVKGVGLVAGGPYYCAGSVGQAPYIPYLANAMSVCMNPRASGTEPPDAVLLWERAKQFASAGLIDDVANLQKQSVFLYSGTRDDTVTTAVVDQASYFYLFAGARTVNYMDTVGSGHGMITDRASDNACPVTAAPYFNNCQLPLAAQMLAQFYPGLKPPSRHLSGQSIAFNQRAYASAATSMAATGYAYVPAPCPKGACRVHVAFHGCHQGYATIGDHFVARAGYNAIADANKIIVLYPQVSPSPFIPYNPKGCWDFWGYSALDPFAPDFFTRSGPQMQAVRAMLLRLSQPVTK
ncbi:MAG: poly(3-hydroxybutyrate) depolymerase [Pseudomonadota bacterium]